MLKADGHLAGKNILIVENEWLVADDLRQELASQGAHVMEPVVSVGRAFKLICKTPRIDVAVLDIHLGDGSDVYPVAELLRRLGVPFVFATGYDEHGVRRDFAGTPHLMKPFTPSALGPILSAISSKPLPDSISLPATWLPEPAPWQD